MNRIANWINKPIDYNKITESYDEKYGASSDFSQWQNIIFKDTEVVDCLSKCLEQIDFDCRDILDIGINNAYEIRVLKNLPSTIQWSNTKITGIDLSLSALEAAKPNLPDSKYQLLNGSILDFYGTDIHNNKQAYIKENSFDLCLAITSLQSSAIFRSSYDTFLTKLTAKMKKHSAFLIMVPNCYIENGELKEGGAYNADKQSPDPNFATDFVNKTSKILSQNNYKINIYGSKFLFILAKRYV